MKKTYLLVALLSCFLFPVFAVLASTSDGTISATNKYAWSENSGWLNFGNVQGNVHVTDTALTGDAWSDNYGWINLNPDHSGVHNDGEGNLSGQAWGEQLGYINFSGVVINSSGQFTGTATGTATGTVNFNCPNCTVTTDWRPVSSRGGVVSSGGGGVTYQNLPAPPEGFSMTINNGDASTNNPTVSLQLDGGPTATSVDISNYADLHDAVNLPYAASEVWTLTQGDGTKSVYVRFHDNSGHASDIISDAIALNTRIPDIKITQTRTIFWSDEDVTEFGTTDPNSQLTFSFNGKFGLTQSDTNGNWLANLGTFAAGSYPIIINVKNQFQNSRSVSISITSQDRPKNVPPTQPTQPGQTTTGGTSLLQNILDRIKLLLNLLPIHNPVTFPTIIIPAAPPLPFQGRWNLLVVRSQQ